MPWLARGWARVAPMIPRLTVGLLTVGLLTVGGCGGAGPYGYDRHYVPLDVEEPHAEAEEPVPYENVRRDPADYRSAKVGWFGVVTGVEPAGDGRTAIHMTYRAHQERHLCRDELDSSCRVTVSEREGGPFTIVVELREADRAGQDRVWVGSLLKVYGSPTGEFDDQGGPMLDADYYRHWPRGKYVTTGARAVMRR